MKPEPWQMRLWRWVERFARAQVRERWMDRVKHDRRCPHCGTWASATPEGWTEKRASTHPMMDWRACGTCGAWSLWWEDMAPVPVDPATLKPLPSFEAARAARLAAPPPDWRLPT